MSLWRLGDAQRHLHEVLAIEANNAEALKEVMPQAFTTLCCSFEGLTYQLKNVEQLLMLERNVAEAFSNKQYNNAISLLVDPQRIR